MTGNTLHLEGTALQIDREVRSMALTSYGYGCWNAPCWFLGPEQGMARNENGNLGGRIEAWCHFGSRELDDCREFHFRIKEERWHGKNAILQPTWAKLLLALEAFSPKDDGDRLEYQKWKWGCQPGETCVIELSGLAANNLNVDRDRESFLDKRIEHIRTRLHEYEPEFVILYGKTAGCRKAWRELTKGAETMVEENPPFAKFRRCGPTLLAWTRHPVARGETNEKWTRLGIRLRQLADPS